jgi:hypothetical protein
VSQTFQITWVGDRTRDWETDKGQFRSYKIALAGYDPSENDPEAGKTVEWSRRRDAQAPSPGDEVFGHIEAKQYDWGTKYVFKTDQAEQGRPASFKKAGANGAGAPASATQDDRSRRIERQHSQEMALRYAAFTGATGGLEKIRELTDWFAADLDVPQTPPAQDKPVTEDVTPARAGTPISDDDSVPF